MYPLNRNRRLRSSSSLRSLLQEHHLTPNNFIVPLFIVEGKQLKEPIPSMPGYFRFSLDLLAEKAKVLWKKEIKAVLLFVKVADKLKDNKGTEALNSDGLMQKAIKTIKTAVPDMIVMTDVALDPYSSFGHDGIVEEGKVLNDPTVAVLAEMALSHAQAGADVVAPIDMMDGRVLSIRQELEEAVVAEHDKAKVLKAMLKAGSNKAEAQALLKKHYAYVDKKYADSPASKKAEMIVTLACTASESNIKEVVSKYDIDLNILAKFTDQNQHILARHYIAKKRGYTKLVLAYKALYDLQSALGHFPRGADKVRSDLDKDLKKYLSKDVDNWKDIWGNL